GAVARVMGGQGDQAVGRHLQLAGVGVLQRRRRTDRGAVDGRMHLPLVRVGGLDEVQLLRVRGTERVVHGQRGGVVVAGRVVRIEWRDDRRGGGGGLVAA